MKFVQFAFLREGTSDDPLLNHLETLLSLAGADEVLGERRTYTGSTQEKLTKLMAEEPSLDVVFVHRDADGSGLQARVDEICAARDTIDNCPPVIPVVPVRATEAWLLADEAAIRAVARRPDGVLNIDMPKFSHIESIANPKQKLQDLICEASELRGAPLAALNRAFAANRAVLLARLDIEGGVKRLPSWSALEARIAGFMTDRFGPS